MCFHSYFKINYKFTNLLNAFLNNKIDKVTSKIIKNIGLSEKLPNGITLLGHIDSIIIDKDGNIDIYQYKPSADMHEVWAEMK